MEDKINEVNTYQEYLKGFMDGKRDFILQKDTKEKIKSLDFETSYSFGYIDSIQYYKLKHEGQSFEEILDCYNIRKQTTGPEIKSCYDKRYNQGKNKESRKRS